MKRKNPQPQPPKWLDKLLEWFCAPHLLEEVHGDLHERYQLRVQKSGIHKANRQYLKEVLVYFRPSIIKRKPQPTPHFIMFRHNLTLIYRNFLRFKSTLFINLIGLSTGLAGALLIYLWMNDELSVDRFHEKDNRLFQVIEHFATREGNSNAVHSIGLLTETLAEEMPRVDYAVASRLRKEKVLSVDDKHRFSYSKIIAQNQDVKIKTSVDTLNSITFEFQFEGLKYSGILDLPKTQTTTSLAILVPGSGRTNIASGNWNYELRSYLNGLGIATYAYDKAGCGNSEGTLDYNQTVQNSSEEVLAAIEELKDQKIPGSVKIGLWGLSRAGWICPLVIEKDPSIAYWISVSGPDHLGNMRYLLETNWRILGKSESEIRQLLEEWQRGFDIQRAGGSYSEYLKATPNLSQDGFIKLIRGDYTEERFLNYQKFLLENKPEIDEKSGIEVTVPNFEKTLNKVKCPVLAIFGEKDSQVDWRSTVKLYQETIGNNSDLTVKTLPDCNHNIETCETCGFQETSEKLKEKGLGQTCDGYYQTILNWLVKKGFGKKM